MEKNSIELENDVFSCKQTGDIAFITFKQNPIEILTNKEVMDAFFSTFERIDDSQIIRGIVITNSSEYTGGFYLKRRISHIIGSLKHETQRRAISRLKHSMEHLVDLFTNITKPTVAALNGDIGETVFGISLACDFRYASSNTIFHHPTVKLGLPTDGVLAFYLIHYIGLPQSIDILLTKTKLSASEVKELGLLTDVTADEELMNRCVEKLNDISQHPNHSISAIKRLIRPDVNEIHKFIDKAFQEILGNLNEIIEALSDDRTVFD